MENAISILQAVAQIKVDQPYIIYDLGYLKLEKKH